MKFYYGHLPVILNTIPTSSWLLSPTLVYAPNFDFLGNFLEEYFSNLIDSMNYKGILIKCRFWLKNKFPNVSSCWSMNHTHGLEKLLTLVTSLFSVKWSEIHLVVSSFLQSHGLYSPWNSSGQITKWVAIPFSKGFFPTQGSDPGLPHCRWILYQLSHQGSILPSRLLSFHISCNCFTGPT